MRLNSQPFHVAALASIAVAQPLFDLFGRSPEFLLAHDLGPSEILALVGIVGVGVSFGCAFIVAVLQRVHLPSARVASSLMIGFFVTLIALYAAKHISGPSWVPAVLAVTAGVCGGVLYHRVASARAFATWLVPGIVIIPLLFLLRPGVRSLVWPQEHQIAQSSASTIPVVFVVFDGLPLTALLDENHEIDRELYPSFAALGDQSTWYRNATTVSDYTQWALPAILSGRYPVPQALPIASDHPNTIFTLLGSSHAISVHEPITRLCPQSLCDHGGEGIANELIAFAEPMSVAYLHTLLPESVQSALPPIDQGWAEGVPPSETPGEVWLRSGDRSRRGEVLAFINAIDADGPTPSLRFIHVLLPHIPLAYLPDGQRYGTERVLPGLLDTRDRWQDDEWAATQGYRQFLLQVGYVDKLLGQLVDRLKDVGLYERALIVVTSDHGGSFRAGRAFRRFTNDTRMDIVPVPLLIKMPNQHEGVTSDRNIETVDILPTVADIMKVEPPWRLDGISAVGPGDPRADKTIYYNGAKQMRKLPASLLDAVFASVAHKVRLFGTEANRYRIPLDSPHHELIGRAVDDLRISETADGLEFALDVGGDFSDVHPYGRFLPAQLVGRARWTNSPDPAVVVVAVNGIVRATTRTYRFPEQGALGAWNLVLSPDAFQPGENDVDIYVTRDSEPPVLHRTAFSHARPVDLLSNAAAYGMGVSYEGLYERDRSGGAAVRWTNGAATIVVPRHGSAAPRSLRVTLATAGTTEKGLVIRINGCDVFEGRVPAARWSRIFALPDCGHDDQSTTIELRSLTDREPTSGRALGVAVERIDLMKYAWPPIAALPDEGRQSQIRFAGGVGDGDTVQSSQRLTLSVVNTGDAIWASHADLGQENGAVRLGVSWYQKGDTTQAAAVQRIDLPRTLAPGDRLDVTLDLVPKGADGRPLPPGEYETWIGMLQEGASWFYTSGDSVRKLRVIHNPRP